MGRGLDLRIPPAVSLASEALVALRRRPSWRPSITFSGSKLDGRALAAVHFTQSRTKMSDHDLTHELCKSLDRHLAFPLLEFLSHRQLYDDADIQRAKIDLLQKTNMVDYAAEIYQGLYNTEDIPEEMNTRRKAVVGKLKTLQVFC